MGIEATLYTDGGSRGNPGPAAMGFVLTIVGREPLCRKEFLGEATNNEAEYRALLAGLAEARRQQVDVIDCFLDSELVVKQLNGLYRVKKYDLKSLYEGVRALAAGFTRISFMHVPREQNKEADKLVNEALDERA